MVIGGDVLAHLKLQGITVSSDLYHQYVLSRLLLAL